MSPAEIFYEVIPHSYLLPASQLRCHNWSC